MIINTLWFLAVVIFAVVINNHSLFMMASTIFVIVGLTMDVLIRLKIWAEFSCFYVGKFLVIQSKGHTAVRGLLLHKVVETDKDAAEACLLAKEYYDNENK